MTFKDDKVKISFSIPWLGILFSVLVVLKLLGKITISWWWVFAPIWIPVLGIVAFLVIGFLIALIIEMMK